MVSNKVACPQCSQEIRVPEKAGRRRLKCPTCSHRFEIGGGERPTEWLVRTANGKQQGPIPDAELDDWIQGGKLDADCELKAAQWAEWRYADAVFPSLAVESSAEATASNPLSEGEFSLESLARADVPRRRRFPSSNRNASLEATIPGIHRVMDELRPWTLLAAANGFVVFGIGTFLLALRIASGISSDDGWMVVSAVIGIVLLAVFCVIPASLLLKVHGRVKSFVEKNDNLSLQWALEGQRQLIRMLAILPFIGLAIVVLVALVAYGSGAVQ